MVWPFQYKFISPVWKWSLNGGPMANLTCVELLNSRLVQYLDVNSLHFDKIRSSFKNHLLNLHWIILFLLSQVFILSEDFCLFLLSIKPKFSWYKFIIVYWKEKNYYLIHPLTYFVLKVKNLGWVLGISLRIVNCTVTIYCPIFLPSNRVFFVY
jgi:hypothetical protein